MAEPWLERAYDESEQQITEWVSAGLQEAFDALADDDVHELVLEIQCRHQNRIDHERKKLDRVHELIVSPDFKIAGGLVKVSSLKEALDG